MKLANSIFILSFLICLTAMAGNKPVARVSNIKGHAFVISSSGTKPLRKGSHINAFDKVVTAENSQVTFTDYFDHQYHLASEGQVFLSTENMTLERGYIWIQSFNKNSTTELNTANAKLMYREGEGILSYNSMDGKTQFLSIKGRFELANAQQDFMREMVNTGHFSLIDDEFANGQPRDATAIGGNSFHKIISLFDKVEPLVGDEAMTKRAKRSIASVKPSTYSPKSNGKYILYKTKISANTPYYHKTKTRLNVDGKSAGTQAKRRPAQTRKKGKVKIKIFSVENMQSEVDQIEPLSAPAQEPLAAPPVIQSLPEVTRGPASSYTQEPVQKVSPSTGAFENSLNREIDKQSRHSDELMNLIRDLKSYKQDYEENY